MDDFEDLRERLRTIELNLATMESMLAMYMAVALAPEALREQITSDDAIEAVVHRLTDDEEEKIIVARAIKRLLQQARGTLAVMNDLPLAGLSSRHGAPPEKPTLRVVEPDDEKTR